MKEFRLVVLQSEPRSREQVEDVFVRRLEEYTITTKISRLGDDRAIVHIGQNGEWSY